jgi:fatty-acyl-CoA synthase
VTPGELEVRGPWVCDRYFHAAQEGTHRDGWLRTGDVATCDERGYFRLVDRTKDLIRSGGEWISSVQLEHALMDHPAVAEAAVVAVPDPRWQERPWACVVLRADRSEDPDGLLGPLAERFPKWWVPDRVLFVDAIPRTATGKFDKRTLRERLRTAVDEEPVSAASDPPSRPAAPRRGSS